MQFQQIPLDKLVPSKTAVRHTNGGVDPLVASIRAEGLLQNLVVVPQAKGRFAVLAGNHRLAALQKLAKQKGSGWTPSSKVPCSVLAAKLAGSAPLAHHLSAAIAENIVREPLHPVDQWEAFSALSHAGMAEDQIRDRFGWTERKLKQVLALGRLHPELRSLVREGKLGIDCAQAYAMIADPKGQLKLYQTLKKGGGWNQHWSVRRHLDERRVEAKYALFSLEKAGLLSEPELFPDRDANGDDDGDDFGDNARKATGHGAATRSFVADPDKFWTLQRQAIDELAAKHRKDGWGKVEIKENYQGHGYLEPPKGMTVVSDSFARAQRGDGLVVLAVARSGQVNTFHFAKPAAAKKAKAAKTRAGKAAAAAGAQSGAGSQDDAGPEMPYPNAVRADLLTVKSLALASAIAGNRRAALEYAVFSILTGGPIKAPVARPWAQVVARRKIAKGEPAIDRSGLAMDMRENFDDALGELLRTIVPDDDLEDMAHGATMVPGEPDAIQLHQRIAGLDDGQLDQLFATLVARTVDCSARETMRRPEQPADALPHHDLWLGGFGPPTAVAWRMSAHGPGEAFFARLPRKTLLAIAGQVFAPDFAKTWRSAKVAELAKAMAERWTWDGAVEDERARRDAWVPPALALTSAPADAGPSAELDEGRADQRATSDSARASPSSREAPATDTTADDAADAGVEPVRDAAE